MLELINILLIKNLNIYQLKIITFIILNEPKNINDISNGLNIKNTKIVNELKKINDEDIIIDFNSEIKLLIKNKEFLINNNSKIKDISIIDEKIILAEEIFDFWKKTFPNEKGELKKTKFNTYKTVIVSALNNYSREDIKKAIIGCSKSLWHMGYDSKTGVYTGQVYDSLELILRPSKIEDFIRKSSLNSLNDQLSILNNASNKNNTNSTSSWLEQRNNLFNK